MNTSNAYIFYVDDDEDDHFFFNHAIEQLPNPPAVKSFYTCTALVQHLEDLANSLPDLIFLDYNMYGNAGCECLKIIKQISRANNIPVIIYSTSSYDALTREALSCGAYKHLVKKESLAAVKEMILGLYDELDKNK